MDRTAGVLGSRGRSRDVSRGLSGEPGNVPVAEGSQLSRVEWVGHVAEGQAVSLDLQASLHSLRVEGHAVGIDLIGPFDPVIPRKVARALPGIRPVVADFPR
jgi:hypothetical protein